MGIKMVYKWVKYYKEQNKTKNTIITLEIFKMEGWFICCSYKIEIIWRQRCAENLGTNNF